MQLSRLCILWRTDDAVDRFRTGVSLHSHTTFSKESLAFIPHYICRVPVLHHMVNWYKRRHRRECGRDIEFHRAWWTPPLTPRQALQLEEGQIERLNLKPIVSLTDHDSIEAAQMLHAANCPNGVPISVEWTVPYGSTFFHLGLHNLPASLATPIYAELASFTAHPVESRLGPLLHDLNAFPGILIVFNHPLWDEKGIGTSQHYALFHRFMKAYGPLLHALELNGWRKWYENRMVIRVAESTGYPVISGGDRHGCEPNAIINLTNAATFDEFAEEVRDGLSQVLILPQYRESRRFRMIRAIADILRHDESHQFGWHRWSDRIFFRTLEGQTETLGTLWENGREPVLIREFIRIVRLFERKSLRFALRLALTDREEVGM